MEKVAGVLTSFYFAEHAPIALHEVQKHHLKKIQAIYFLSLPKPKKQKQLVDRTMFEFSTNTDSEIVGNLKKKKRMRCKYGPLAAGYSGLQKNQNQKHDDTILKLSEASSGLYSLISLE